jgi:hypothetical protein
MYVPAGKLFKLTVSFAKELCKSCPSILKISAIPLKPGTVTLPVVGFGNTF